MATLTFRTDKRVDAALRGLMADGADRSTAIRNAILTAWRVRQADLLRAEAEALASDETDVAEMRAVLAELEPARAR